MLLRNIAILAGGITLLSGCEDLQGAWDTTTGSLTPASQAAAPPVEPANPGFRGEDLVIWNSLSDQAKADALVFIENGGTLKQFVSQ